jgi:hypothetical protein
VLVVHPQGGDRLRDVRMHDVLLAACLSFVPTTSGTRRDGQSAAGRPARERAAGGVPGHRRLRPAPHRTLREAGRRAGRQRRHAGREYLRM